MHIRNMQSENHCERPSLFLVIKNGGMLRGVSYYRMIGSYLTFVPLLTMMITIET